MPKPAPPGYRELNVGEIIPRNHWFYDYGKQSTPFVHCDKPDELGQGIGDPYDPENHAAGRYVKLPDYELTEEDQHQEGKSTFATWKPEKGTMQKCRCKYARREPVPPEYRELDDNEIILGTDVQFRAPDYNDYALVKAKGRGQPYDPMSKHTCGRFRKIESISQSTNQGEDTMQSTKLFETRHLVNGKNINDMHAEEIYGIITQREAQIENLKKATHQPAKLKKYIAELEQELVDLVKFLDENDAKAEPTESQKAG